ncbi:helix-turn-helix transcriptional regulator [Parahaliea aestuarii]|nr:helix-turn-helix transcriptional regulator [Parahaliea aestuarii]
MAINSEIGRIIGEIYDSAIDAGRLPQALASVSRLVGADYGVIALGDRYNASVNYRIAVPDGGGDKHLSDVLCDSDWISYVLDQQPGRVLSHSTLPASQRQARRLNGRLRGIDFGRGLSGGFFLKKSGYCYISFCRRDGGEAFSAEEIARLELLTPHVQQAFEINRHVQERSVLHDVVRERYEQLSTGVVLLDRDACVVFSNAWARRLFREPGGIHCVDGRLGVASPEEDRKLAGLIEHCIRTSHIKGVMTDGYVAVPRHEQDKAPLAISVSGYSSSDDARPLLPAATSVMLLLYDVERRNSSQRYILEQLYRLTPSEAALAAGLAAGKTLNEIANAGGVSRETLRSQLKRVFHKTSTNRQSDLVKLVLTGPGSLLV